MVDKRKTKIESLVKSDDRKTKGCNMCGELFEIPKYQQSRKYCSMQCYQRKMKDCRDYVKNVEAKDKESGLQNVSYYFWMWSAVCGGIIVTLIMMYVLLMFLGTIFL